MNDETCASLKSYRRLLAFAYFEFRWRECRFAACRKRQRCTGGPRGTYSRLGIPRCMSADEADEILGAARSREDA